MTQLSRRGALQGAFGLAGTAAMASFAATDAGAAVLGGQGFTDSRFLFDLDHYVARGTVFTRSVKYMPIAANSKEIAANMKTVSNSAVAKSHGRSNQDWLFTGVNTDSYNIPIYVVDSRNPNCPKKQFHTLGYGYDTPPMLNGLIPCPDYAGPAYGNDKSMAIYDMGTGIMREFFGCDWTDGVWVCRFGGWSQIAGPDLTSMYLNPGMELTWGSSSVVKMHNPLSQIGLREIEAGVIGHALSVTLADGAPGYSWPAKGSDGGFTTLPTLREGQWFRFNPSLDIDSLNVKPVTRMAMKAIQRFGGYGADHNFQVTAFNVEAPMSVPGQNEDTLIVPLVKRMGTGMWIQDLNDFPWELIEVAEVDWKGMTQQPVPPRPIPYSTSDWTITSKRGAYRDGHAPAYTLLPLSMEFSGALQDHSVGGLTWRKKATTTTNATKVSIAPYVQVRERAVTVTVKVNGSIVATMNTRAVKSLTWTMPTGSNVVEIDFQSAGDAEMDAVWLGPITPV